MPGLFFILTNDICFTKPDTNCSILNNRGSCFCQRHGSPLHILHSLYLPHQAVLSVRFMDTHFKSGSSSICFGWSSYLCGHFDLLRMSTLFTGHFVHLWTGVVISCTLNRRHGAEADALRPTIRRSLSPLLEVVQTLWLMIRSIWSQSNRTEVYRFLEHLI